MDDTEKSLTAVKQEAVAWAQNGWVSASWRYLFSGPGPIVDVLTHRLSERNERTGRSPYLLPEIMDWFLWLGGLEAVAGIRMTLEEIDGLAHTFLSGGLLEADPRLSRRFPWRGFDPGPVHIGKNCLERYDWTRPEILRFLENTGRLPMRVASELVDRTPLVVPFFGELRALTPVVESLTSDGGRGPSYIKVVHVCFQPESRALAQYCRELDLVPEAVAQKCLGVSIAWTTGNLTLYWNLYMTDGIPAGSSDNEFFGKPRVGTFSIDAESVGALSMNAALQTLSMVEWAHRFDTVHTAWRANTESSWSDTYEQLLNAALRLETISGDVWSAEKLMRVTELLGDACSPMTPKDRFAELIVRKNEGGLVRYAWPSGRGRYAIPTTPEQMPRFWAEIFATGGLPKLLGVPKVKKASGPRSLSPGR